MSIMKKKILLSILYLFCTVVFAQKSFEINRKGEIANKEVRDAFMLKNNYEILSAFDTIHRNPLKVVAIVGRNNKLGLINLKGEEITPVIYAGIHLDYIREFLYQSRGDLKTIVVNKKKDNLYGVIDYNGKTIIDCSYKFLSDYTLKGKKIFMAADSSYNFYNFSESGRLLNTKYDADQIDRINRKEKRARIKSESRYKVDKTTSSSDIHITYKKEGKTYSIPKKYGETWGIQHAHYKAFIYNPKTKLRGFYDYKNNKVLLEVKYKEVRHEREANVIITRNENRKFELFDFNGQKILPGEYDHISYKDGFYDVCNGKCAIYNKDLKQLTKFDNYGKRFAYYDYCVFDKEKYGLVSSNRGLVLDSKFDRIDIVKPCEDCEFIFLTRKDEEYNAYNTKGERDTNEDYNQIFPLFYEKLWVNSGKISTKIRNKTHYHLKYFLARQDNKLFILDHALQKIKVPKFDDVKRGSQDQISISYNGKWGVYDLNKEALVIPMEYKRIQSLKRENLFFAAEVDENFYVLFDKEGKIMIPKLKHKPFAIRLDEKGLYEISFFKRGIPSLYFDYAGNSRQQE